MRVIRVNNDPIFVLKFETIITHSLKESTLNWEPRYTLLFSTKKPPQNLREFIQGIKNAFSASLQVYEVSWIPIAVITDS